MLSAWCGHLVNTNRYVPKTYRRLDMSLFDARQYDPTARFDPLPEGWYSVAAKSAELRPTKDGTGQIVVVQFEVQEGDNQGRVFFDRFNIVNKNEIAQSIGRKQLSALCYATGIIQVDDPSQLVGIPLQVRLAVKAGSDGYDPTNVVKEYRTIAGVKPSDIYAGTAATATQAPTKAPVAPQAKPTFTAPKAVASMKPKV